MSEAYIEHAVAGSAVPTAPDPAIEAHRLATARRRLREDYDAGRLDEAAYIAAGAALRTAEPPQAPTPAPTMAPDAMRTYLRDLNGVLDRIDREASPEVRDHLWATLAHDALERV